MFKPDIPRSVFSALGKGAEKVVIKVITFGVTREPSAPTLPVRQQEQLQNLDVQPSKATYDPQRSRLPGHSEDMFAFYGLDPVAELRKRAASGE